MADEFRQRIPQSFVEIADTARLLYTFYQKGTAEYHRAKSGLEFVRSAIWRTNPEQATNAFPAKGTMLYDALHDYKCRSEHCCEHAMMVASLGYAVATLLPGLWPSLRLVGGGEQWHEAEEFNWDAAIGELRQIEAAALSAAYNATPSPAVPPKQGEGTGNGTPSPAAKQRQSEGNGGTSKTRKARKKRSDPKADKRIAEAYDNGGYATEAAFAAKEGLTEITVHRARDRHRKRQEAKEKARRK